MKFHPIVLSCLLFSSVLFSEVHAAEWVAEPTLTLGSTYNDNITFRETDELDDTSTTLSARLNSQIKEQIWDVNLDGRVRRSQYSNDAGSDTNNIFINFGSNYRTELHSWNFDVDFERNTTFDEDFDTQLSANDLLDEQTQRERTIISPGWNWNISQSWLLQVSLGLTDIKYDEVNSLDLSDSETKSAQLATQYQVDDMSYLTVSVAYSKTERDQDRRQPGFYEYENTNYQLSYRYQTSENASLNIGLGRRGTDTTLFIFPDDINTTNSGNTFSVSYNYDYEISNYSVTLDRSVTTSSNGFAQEVDDFTLRYNRNLSETVSFGLILNALQSTSIDSVSVSEDRDTVRIEPSVSWRFTKDSRLNVGYRHRRQAFAASDDEAESNSIYINLSFFWPKLMSSY